MTSVLKICVNLRNLRFLPFLYFLSSKGLATSFVENLCAMRGFWWFSTKGAKKPEAHGLCIFFFASFVPFVANLILLEFPSRFRGFASSWDRTAQLQNLRVRELVRLREALDTPYFQSPAVREVVRHFRLAATFRPMLDQARSLMTPTTLRLTVAQTGTIRRIAAGAAPNRDQFLSIRSK